MQTYIGELVFKIPFKIRIEADSVKEARDILIDEAENLINDDITAEASRLSLTVQDIKSVSIAYREGGGWRKNIWTHEYSIYEIPKADPREGS